MSPSTISVLRALKNIAEPVRVYRVAGTPRVSVTSTGSTIRQAVDCCVTVLEHEW